jgi:hypothetical protein
MDLFIYGNGFQQGRHHRKLYMGIWKTIGEFSDFERRLLFII